jgi:hypothetical protein
MPLVNELRHEFPKEYLIAFDGHNFLEGRLTVNAIGEHFSVEIDIVFIESKKIYRHIDILYHQQSVQEALDNGVQSLSFYLKKLSN